MALVYVYNITKIHTKIDIRKDGRHGTGGAGVCLASRIDIHTPVTDTCHEQSTHMKVGFGIPLIHRYATCLPSERRRETLTQDITLSHALTRPHACNPTGSMWGHVHVRSSSSSLTHIVALASARYPHSTHPRNPKP